MNRRAVFLLAGIGFVALFVAIWLMVRVERTLAPAPDDALPVKQDTTGVPKLKQESLISGLSHVWDIGFLPDETALFTERDGAISKLTNGKKTVLLQVPNVIAQGEGGLMGLVVDPDFSKNHYIYACYNTPQDIRISRWQVNNGATKLTNQKDIVTGLPIVPDSGRHSGCRPRFGADGYLWIGTGDVAKGTNPQDPKSLGGKVLRVDRDGKAAALGNLASPFDPRIYNYGHRNVQGMAMFDKPQNGVFGYSVEHGPNKDDEVNLLVPGNMGWDPIPGFYNESVPMTDKTKYPDAIEAVWHSGNVAIAPSGSTIITGDKWLSLSGRLAIAVLKNKHVRLLEFDNVSTLKSEEVLFEGEFGRVRSVVMGPDDNMYLTTDNGDGEDQIIRVTPR